QQWVPVAQAAQPQQYQVGQVVNGHRWDGQQWVPVAQAAQPQQYQVGQVVNGHRWDGQQWVPVAQAPQVGEVQNGYRWNGSQWEPMAQAASADSWLEPTVGQAEAVSPHSNIQGRLRALAESWQFTWEDSGDKATITRVLAERTSVLARQKLEYRATIIVDDAAWQVRYSDSLKETGGGFTSGDPGESSGFGFSGGTYSSTGGEGLADDIAEQITHFAKAYTFDFSYEQWREQVRTIAAEAGYEFVTGV
ncbi:MAG TPA: hypothetical protein PKD84_02430, partial [Propionicimonas sp.]|nr:hypothetical protein [Propionicimonas sp.]